MLRTESSNEFIMPTFKRGDKVKIKESAEHLFLEARFCIGKTGVVVQSEECVAGTICTVATEVDGHTVTAAWLGTELESVKVKTDIPLSGCAFMCVEGEGVRFGCVPGRSRQYLCRFYSSAVLFFKCNHATEDDLECRSKEAQREALRFAQNKLLEIKEENENAAD